LIALLKAMPAPPDENLEFQFDRRVTELESRFAFQEQALQEMSDALAAARAEGARNHELLQRALEDLKQLRTLLYSDPADEPPPPHY
jgi:SlyX protein